MFSIQSRTEESTTLIADALQLTAEIGVEGALLFGGVLVLYVVIGTFMTKIMNIGTPYPPLSLGADPVLLITGTIVGIFTVQGAGSLLLYHLLVGIREESAQSVTLGLIALGIGGALLEITLPGTLDLLVGYF